MSVFDKMKAKKIPPFNQARFWLGRARDAGHISADMALRTDAKGLPIV